MISPPAEAATLPEEKDFLPPPSIKPDDAGDFGASTRMRELSVLLRALSSFFNLYNYPFPEASQADLITHDWTNEVRIVRGTLLRCSELVFQSINFDNSDNTIFDETDAAAALAPFSRSDSAAEVKSGLK